MCLTAPQCPGGTYLSLARCHLPAALPSSTLLTKMPSPCSEPPRTLKPSLPSVLFSTVMALMTSLSLLLAAGTDVSPLRLLLGDTAIPRQGQLSGWVLTYLR